MDELGELTEAAQLAALGGVLSFVQRKRLLEAGGCISRLEMIALDEYMMVDLETLRSLDVVREEQHPGTARASSSRKDGFSLFTLLDRTHSALGKRALRRWVLQPLADAPRIEERLDAVAFLQLPAAQALQGDLARALGGLRDLVRLVARLRQRTASCSDWMAFAESIYSAGSVLEHLRIVLQAVEQSPDALPGSPPAILQDAAHRAQHREVLEQVGEMLSLVDWEETRLSGWMVPATGVSVALDTARERYAELDVVLDQAGARLRLQYAFLAAELLDALSVVYIPVLGFLVQREEPEQELRDSQQQEQQQGQQEEDQQQAGALPGDLVECFAQDMGGRRLAYFRCELTESLNEQHGDLFQIVRDEEQRVMCEVESRVLGLEAGVLAAARAVAELDVLLSFATTSADFEYTRPELNESRCTIAQQARHPLLMHNVEQVVPNDIRVGPADCTEAEEQEQEQEQEQGEGEARFTLPQGELLLLLGKNYSGKSVYLKTVGLVQVMAQIGCFVPAAHARVGIVDRLFTRMGSLESCTELEVSSFSLDVQQVAAMLRSATPRSLLLLDEFGKGSSGADGASLLVGVLRELAGREETPRTLVTTHLFEVLERGVLCDSQRIVRCEMQVLAEEAPGEERVEVTPLFKLVRAGDVNLATSHALVCARQANVPQSIVDRAGVILSLQAHGLEVGDAAHDARLAAAVDRIAKRDWAKASSADLRELLRELAEAAREEAPAE